MSQEINEVTGILRLFTSPNRGMKPADGIIRAVTIITSEKDGNSSKKTKKYLKRKALTFQVVKLQPLKPTLIIYCSGRIFILTTTRSRLRLVQRWIMGLPASLATLLGWRLFVLVHRHASMIIKQAAIVCIRPLKLGWKFAGGQC